MLSPPPPCRACSRYLLPAAAAAAAPPTAAPPPRARTASLTDNGWGLAAPPSPRRLRRRPRCRVPVRRRPPFSSSPCLASPAQQCGAFFVLGSRGKAMRYAVRNKESWKRRHAPTRDPSTSPSLLPRLASPAVWCFVAAPAAAASSCCFSSCSFSTAAAAAAADSVAAPPCRA